MRKALDDRLEAAGADEEWARVLADLDRLTHVDVVKDGKALSRPGPRTRRRLVFANVTANPTAF